jgi:mono/diheme cytochrome c family protein
MKLTAFLTSLLLLLLSACTNNRLQQSVLTPNNLKSTFISLTVAEAYNLKTPKGAILKIAKNSFATKGKVQLEIKEAYTLQDILLAGLATESNGKPLKSSGMIYVNATADGKTVELLQPIKISIPTAIYDDKMQLFKGEIQSDISINWVDPQPLDTSLTARKLLLGKRLFKANCASCHKPMKDFTGPALAGCRERSPDRDWPYRFTVNTHRMTEGDNYARELIKKYSSAMPQFNLSREDVNAILDYCDNEAALNPFANVNTTPMQGIADSISSNTIKKPCGYDTIYYAEPDTSITILQYDTLLNELPESNINNYKEEEYKENLRQGFTDPNITNGMYDFKIKTLGWYNVDAFFEGYQGSTFVILKAQLQIQFEAEMHVYLFCPDKKFLSVAYNRKGNNYLFDKVNGKIPLFLNDNAIIVAFGSKADKMFYGTASFNIKTEQTITIQIKETTEAQLKSFIQNNKIDGIEIDINKKDDFNIIEKPCDGVYRIK